MVLKSLIKCFELVSGFKVDWSKSQLSSIGFTDTENIHMAGILGYSYRGWLNENLGLPLGGLSWNKDFWEPVLDRCSKKLT